MLLATNSFMRKKQRRNRVKHGWKEQDNMLLERFYPDVYLDSAYDIDYAALKEE